ncbi:MAG TPA: lactonase family protein [Opitutaceae bacterium]
MNPIPGMKMAALAWLSGALAMAASVPVYFGTGATGGSKGIYRATLDTTKVRLSEAVLVAEVKAPGFLALHPDGDKLYAAANVEGGGAIGYRIQPGGKLEAINAMPTGDGIGAHIAVHPSGKFLLTAQYSGGSTALFPLDADGKLGKATVHKHEGKGSGVKPPQSQPRAHWAGFSPDGKFALVPDLGNDRIAIYRVDLAGPSLALHGYAVAAPGAGPRHMRFSTDGKFIHLLNEFSLSVTTFAWDAATGTTKLISDVPTLSEEVKARETHNSGAEILVHPSGRFVYTSNRGNDTVTVFQRDADATLKVAQVHNVRSAFPRNINLSPDGGWLLAGGQDSNTVTVHKVDPKTGELTYQTKGVINVPSPICILFATK